MDPFSISVSVVTIIAACAQVVKILKETVETLKQAAAFLLQLLSQTERVRLFLEQLRSLTKQLSSRNEILLAFSPSGPEATINELSLFVRDMARKPRLMKLKMLLERSTADKFVKRLHRHEEEITQVLVSVATASAIRTEEEIQRMREDALFRAKVTFPFSSETSTTIDAPGSQIDSPSLIARRIDTPKAKELEEVDTNVQSAGGSGVTGTSSMTTPSAVEDQTSDSSSPPAGPGTPITSDTETLRDDLDSEDEDEDEVSQESRKLQIWFGDLARPGFDESYLSLRDRLSDAAYWGDFDRIVSVLAEVERKYQQSWANAPRLSRDPQQSSGWTPLHQAAFMGAHQDRVIHLVRDFGALRLLRTAWTDAAELPYRNMTAAEIARDAGFTDLYTVLAPVIYHCIPPAVLATLETHFHGLIHRDLRESMHELASLRLPDLNVLTELKVPMMWFPLKPRGLNRVRGYMYRLDGRELLVKTFGMAQMTPDPRPAKCPVLSCEYHTRGFAREYDKVRHVLTHYKGVVICPFCPASGSDAERSFERIDLFKRHLITVHGVEQLPLISQTQTQSFTPLVREPLNQHQEACTDCSICSATFVNAQELYEHLNPCVIRFVQQEEPSEDVEQGLDVEDHQRTGIYRISEGGVLEIEEAIAFNV